MILILHNDLAFASLAAALDLLGWQVTHVRSCTFPSRPEPREATWSDAAGHPQMHYLYEPDVEVRALVFLQPVPEDTSPDAWLASVLGGPCTHDLVWLAQACVSGEHRVAQHAAAALRLVATRDARRDHRQDAQRALLTALMSSSVHARRATCAQLATLAIPDAREVLQACVEEDPDLEVRVHARRALEHLMTTSLTRR